MTADAPAIATIILNWNGRDTTLACVQTVLDCGQPPASVIVVDNGSSDDSVAALRARFPALTVLAAGENLGFARGNNLGVRHALDTLAPALIFLLNNDAFINPDTLPRLQAALAANPQAGAAAPKIYAGDGQRLWYAGGYVDWRIGTGVHQHKGARDRGQADAARAVGFAPGCALLLRRDAIEPAGVFDERYFFMGEDVDLSLRLTHAGRPLLYAPDATVVHQVGASVARQGQPFIWYHMTRNRLLTVSKHATPTQKLRFFSYWPLLWAFKAAQFALAGNPAIAQAIGRGVRDFRRQQFSRE